MMSLQEIYRIYAAAAAKPGLEAELKFSEQAGKGYAATMVRTANALDPVLRTLQVELELDNAQREVFPGVPSGPRTLIVLESPHGTSRAENLLPSMTLFDCCSADKRLPRFDNHHRPAPVPRRVL